MDKALGVKLASEMISYYYNEALEFSKIEFKNLMDS